MNDRLKLHSDLVSIMGAGNVYYQPPQNIRMSYPCCVYSLDRINDYSANNKAYFFINQYSVTLITKNPEDPAVDELLKMPYTSFDHHFVVDNLHHFEFVVKRKRNTSIE